MAIESLLASASLTSPIDVPNLLSSEYDSDAPSTLEQSYDQSGDFSSVAPTPVVQRTQLMQQGAEMSEMERERRREQRRDADTIQQLRNENMQLRQVAAAAEAQGAEDLKAYHNAVESAAARSRSELTELRTKLVELQSEMPQLRGRLAAGKGEFAHLLIEHGRYSSLRQCAEHEVSVVEHVQMRVYDMMRKAERDGAVAAEARSTTDSLAEKLRAERDAREALTIRLAEVGARAEAKSREAEELRIEGRRLRAELQAAQAGPEGAAKAALEIAEQRLVATSDAANEGARLLGEAKAAAARAEKAHEEAASRASYLSQDKEYLTLQLRTLEERTASAEARAAKEEMSAMEIGRQLAVAKEALMGNARDAAEDYKQRLEGEMLRWQSVSKSAHEAHAEAHAAAVSTCVPSYILPSYLPTFLLSYFPTHSTVRERCVRETPWPLPLATWHALLSRPPWCHVACPPHPTSLGATWQVSTHKDSREMALADADKWQTRYAELKREYDEAVLAAAEAAGRHEASSAELRSEARLKSFEAERLRMQTEQAMVSARQAAVDAEAKGEKLELLKSEYYSLKTASATKIAQLEASSAALTARIGTYEALEEELDRTVLQAGAIAAIESGGGADGGGGEGGGHGMQPYLRVPSSAQRRMQQCLTLAKDLLTTQRRAETSEAKLLEAMGEAERLQTVVEELQRRVRQGGQPQSYLVQQVESAEATRIETEAKLAVVTQQLAEHEEALAAARAQNEQLLTDLESLLSQRGSLDALRATLTRLLPLEMLPALAPQIA